MTNEQIAEARALCALMGQAIRRSHDWGYAHVKYTPVIAEDIDRALTAALDALEEARAEVARRRARKKESDQRGQTIRTLEARLVRRNRKSARQHEALNALKAENVRLREALETVAWTDDLTDGPDAIRGLMRCGDVARAALYGAPDPSWPDPGEQVVS